MRDIRILMISAWSSCWECNTEVAAAGAQICSSDFFSGNAAEFAGEIRMIVQYNAIMFVNEVNEMTEFGYKN